MRTSVRRSTPPDDAARRIVARVEWRIAGSHNKEIAAEKDVKRLMAHLPHRAPEGSGRRWYRIQDCPPHCRIAKRAANLPDNSCATGGQPIATDTDPPRVDRCRAGARLFS